jgi:hypothetical protein
MTVLEADSEALLDAIRNLLVAKNVLAVSNLKCNTRRFSGWFHGTGL